MGTVASLDVRGRAPDGAAIEACFSRLQRADATFSTYRRDSEVCRYDRGEVDEPSPELRWVLARCDALKRATGGASTPTRPVSLDPSALVKGWAVQRAADALQAAGVHDFCLSAGGDVVARGKPSPGTRWRVGIQHPEDRDALAAVVELDDSAVATSGSYERGAHIVGRRRRRGALGHRRRPRPRNRRRLLDRRLRHGHRTARAGPPASTATRP